jgi:nucleoside-diphosphate-sugar epimerase
LVITSKNKNIYGNYYNIACNKNINLNEIIILLSKYFKKDIKPIYKKERKGDMKHSLASIEKIKKDLSYEPIVYFNEGISKLIKWYTDLRN